MAAMNDSKPRILDSCATGSYAGADLCEFPAISIPSIKIIRVMCSGRVDLEFVLRAFENGIDGVFVGGCWLGECHYVTEGNYDALSMMHLGKKFRIHRTESGPLEA
jgi:coenzyme F420-reducing hydrogenase delta subunit